MALNAATLGTALYNGRETFNNTPWADLLTAYGSEAGIRQAIANADAEAILAHITANAIVMPTALLAPTGAVTGTGTVL